MALPKPIVIQGYQKGISQGPFVDGFSDMRNIDVQSRPGSARLNFALQAVKPTPVSGTFTVNTGTDIITTNTTFGTTIVAVTVSSSGSLPGGLAAATTYYLKSQSSVTYTMYTDYALAAAAGTPIDITTSGSGTLSIQTVNMAVPKYIVTDPANSGVYWLQDSIGQIWYTAATALNTWVLISGNTLANAHGNGLVVFNNYLLVFRDTIIDVYDLMASLGAVASWNNGWKTIYTGTASLDSTQITYKDHTPFYTPLNGIVYWSETKFSADGNPFPQGQVGLGALQQVDNKKFSPTDSTTFVLQTGSSNTFALMLPPYHYITAIILVGTNLQLGTNQNIIYPWNTTAATYDLPIIIPEAGTNYNSIVNVGNYFYFIAGLKGNIYMFNGYTTTKVGQIPPYLTNSPLNNVTAANMIKHNGRIYFAVSCVGCSGVWSFNPNNNIIVLEQEVSLNTFGTTNTLTLGALFSVANEQVLFGWYDTDSTTYGLDATFAPGHYYETGYNAYLETQFFNIGQFNAPRGLENFNIYLGAPLSTGQGVKIYSRGDTSSSYSGTPDATFDFATYGAYDSIKLPFGKSFVNVQFRVYLTTGASSNTTPQLNTITVY